MNHFIDKIPEMVVDYVKSITEHKKLNIKVVKPRKTKHGDFRERNSNYTITINDTNNKYRFLMILIHEIAHFNVLKKKFKLKIINFREIAKIVDNYLLSKKYKPGIIKLLLGFDGFSSMPTIFLLLSNSITPNFSGSGTGNPNTLPPFSCILRRAEFA